MYLIIYLMEADIEMEQQHDIMLTKIEIDNLIKTKSIDLKLIEWSKSKTLMRYNKLNSKELYIMNLYSVSYVTMFYRPSTDLPQI